MHCGLTLDQLSGSAWRGRGARSGLLVNFRSRRRTTCILGWLKAWCGHTPGEHVAKSNRGGNRVRHPYAGMDWGCIACAEGEVGVKIPMNVSGRRTPPGNVYQHCQVAGEGEGDSPDDAAFDASFVDADPDCDKRETCIQIHECGNAPIRVSTIRRKPSPSPISAWTGR